MTKTPPNSLCSSPVCPRFTGGIQSPSEVTYTTFVNFVVFRSSPRLNSLFGSAFCYHASFHCTGARHFFIQTPWRLFRFHFERSFLGLWIQHSHILNSDRGSNHVLLSGRLFFNLTSRTHFFQKVICLQFQYLSALLGLIYRWFIAFVFPSKADSISKAISLNFNYSPNGVHISN